MKETEDQEVYVRQGSSARAASPCGVVGALVNGAGKVGCLSKLCGYRWYTDSRNPSDAVVERLARILSAPTDVHCGDRCIQSLAIKNGQIQLAGGKFSSAWVGRAAELTFMDFLQERSELRRDVHRRCRPLRVYLLTKLRKPQDMIAGDRADHLRPLVLLLGYQAMVKHRPEHRIGEDRRFSGLIDLNKIPANLEPKVRKNSLLCALAIEAGFYANITVVAVSGNLYWQRWKNEASVC